MFGEIEFIPPYLRRKKKKSIPLNHIDQVSLAWVGVGLVKGELGCIQCRLSSRDETIVNLQRWLVVKRAGLLYPCVYEDLFIL